MLSGLSKPPTAKPSGDSSFSNDERVVYHDVAAKRPAQFVALDEVSLTRSVKTALNTAGINRFYPYQAQAINALISGESVVLNGATSSGKSLCYQTPLLAFLEQRRAVSDAIAGRKQTVLYLAPTKALAQDQARRLRLFQAAWITPRLYDGDTSINERRVIRKNANVILTNPDMLSTGILPNHGEWSVFLRGLAMVVIDEAHVYRGVFGSHVAHVIRRLKRLLNYYGNNQAVFCLSSATIANAQSHAMQLCGISAPRVFGDEGAPQAEREIILWNPKYDDEAERRDSVLYDSAKLLTELLTTDSTASAIVFCRSRTACELVARYTQDLLKSRGFPLIAEAVASYRAGYTREQRRQVEQDLVSGRLRAVVATSALELGIDIGSLSASFVAGFPGTVTSLKQRWGRSGRLAGARGLAVLIASDDALDQYFMNHPNELINRSVESAVISTHNPRILEPHLLAAASELPLSAKDDAVWNPSDLAQSIARLEAQGLMRISSKGAACLTKDNPAARISLRSINSDKVRIVTQAGELLGDVDLNRAPKTVYPGAIYLHQGVSYRVVELSTSTLTSLVEAVTVEYHTRAKISTQTEVQSILDEKILPDGSRLNFGYLRVTDQHTGYQVINSKTHAEEGVIEQFLPPLTFETEAVWWSAPKQWQQHDVDDLVSALHAAEHVLISVLPLFAMCDRWDIGGLSTNFHEAFSDGGGIFIYDGLPGGVGITKTGFDHFEAWVTKALSVLQNCPCKRGCPSCVQSPKCGNLNEYLDKKLATEYLKCLISQ